MSKEYIFFCYSTGVGGGQNYVNSKIKYLEENGWTIKVFTPGIKNRIDFCPWPYLKKYAIHFAPELVAGPETFSKQKQTRILNWMIRITEGNFEEVIIESHTDYWAEWGELLAQKLKGINFCFLLDEQLSLYRAKEFLYYKFLRHEVAGIHSTSMKKLFSGYKEINESDEYVLSASNLGSVQDVPFHKNIEKKDINIAYIGRPKQYCEEIKKSIINFANNHREKDIQVIVIGQLGKTKELKKVNNIFVTELGFMTPIPKAIFNYIDCAIAGAGCARIAYNQNKITIIADAQSLKSTGILGYTTTSTLFSEKQFEYSDLLEDVFFRDVLKNCPKIDFCNSNNPYAEYKKHFDFIYKNSLSNKETYFDFKKHSQNNKLKKKYCLFLIKCLLKYYFPHIILFLKK